MNLTTSNSPARAQAINLQPPPDRYRGFKLPYLRNMNYWHKKPIPHSDYYAVIFCSAKSDDLEGYPEMDKLLLETAMKQAGFLGYESAGGPDGGIFISYWQDETSIKAWREDAMHQEGIKNGMERWYKRYLSQVCKVVRSHELEKNL